MHPPQSGTLESTAPPAPSPEPVYTTVHLCIDIRGLLRRTDRELRGWIRNAEGRVVSAAEARELLLDELAKGRKVLPTTDPPCEGFSYETGCPGHREVR